MKDKVLKNSMLSIVLGGIAIFSASAGAEISAEGRAAGQASAAAGAAITASDSHADASSVNRAAVTGSAGARVDDAAIRNSVMQNGSAAANAGVTAAHDTVLNAERSGRSLAREAAYASRSVSVNADAGALADGTVVETGDGISVNLDSVTSGNAGANVRPLDANHTLTALGGEAGRMSAGVKGNVSTAAQAAISAAHNTAGATHGAISANGGLTTDIDSSNAVQQDISSTVESSVEEGAEQARGAVNAAIDAAAAVTAEARSQTDAALEETKNLNADASGDFGLTGDGALGL